MGYLSVTGQDQGRCAEILEGLELTEFGEPAHASVDQARFKTPADLAGQYRPDPLQLVLSQDLHGI